MTALPHPDPLGTPPIEASDPAPLALTTAPTSAPAPFLPPLSSLLAWREPYLIPLLLLAVTRIALWALLPMAAEDAYITYRYSRSLVLGLGAVFNPGERVMGFSSPLWMVWNALGWMLTRDPVTWSRATALVADATTLVLAAWMLRRHLSRASAWCFAFLYATWTTFAGVAVSGMENGVMTALIVLAAALAERRSAAAGPALAALALVRPEGIAAAAVVALGARWRDRALALAIVAVAALGLWAWYGSPLPQSVTAKASLYGTPGPWLGRHWWEWASPMALGRWPLVPDGRFLFLMAVVAGPAAAVGARELWRVRTSPAAVAALACVTVWLGYSLVGVAYFFWYLVVPLTGFFLLVAAGLPRIVRGRAIYAGGVLFVLGCWTVVWELYAGRAGAETAFAEVAEVLVQRSSPWDKVLLEPIGIVGYRAKVRVLDEVGLVSPAIARRRMQGPGWLADVLDQERPEWWVVRRGVIQSGEAFAGRGRPFRSPTERDRVMAGYRLAQVVDEGSGEHALLVLRRTP